MSNYVITGGAGFLGAHLAARLGSAGHNVRVVDSMRGTDSRERAMALAKIPHVSVGMGDICDPVLCRNACEGAEYVLHFAAETSPVRSWEDPAACMTTNVNGTLQMLAAARSVGTVRRFVLASCASVYGDTPAATKHEAGMVDPLTPLAASKLSAEYACRCWFRQHGLSTVALRFFTVYGPGQSADGPDAGAMPRFLSAIGRGERPVIYGDGEQTRDFVYVDDAVEACLRACAAQRGASGKVFNIGTGQPASLNQIIEKLERYLRKSISVQKEDARPGEIKRQRADTAAAAGLLQFTPSVRLDDGLERTLHAFLAVQTQGVKLAA